MISNRTGYLYRYGAVLLILLAATAGRQLLSPVLFDYARFVTFYVAVIVTSILFGLGPAIFAMLGGGLIATYLFTPPVLSLRIPTAADLVWLGLYLGICITIIAAVESRTRAAALARHRLAELQSEQEKRASAEREREEQRRWAVQTLSSIGDGVITTDALGRVTFLNRVASELSGWKPEEAVGQPVETVFRIVNEQSGREVESPVIRVLRDGIVVGLANHTSLIRKDGVQIPIDDSGAPIRDLGGEVRGAVLVFRDFTARRLNEEANARLAAIVNFSQDAIISKSLEGVIQTWNPGAERVFGYSAAEAVGRRMALLVPPGREHEESNLIETVRSGNAVEGMESVRLRKDGTAIHVSISVSPLYDGHGELIGISHIARDVTAQKELHAQLLQAQKLERLRVLAGGVAHDFNNLLTGIIGSSSLLTDILDPASEEAAIAEQITRAGGRAAHLTQQLLAYSGKGRFVLEDLDASASIREIIDLVKASIPRTAEIVLDMADALPRIEADPAQFQQVVMNLVINAAEAMGGAPGTVTVRTEARYLTPDDISKRPEFVGLLPGEHLVLMVRDDGSGMDPATLARIFDPFFSTKFTGRGLGLAAVQGIVRGHKGAVRVDSAPGRGTTFEIYFPAAEPAHARQAARSSGRPAILVADDEEVVRETARLTLQREGFEVLLAANGQEALQLLEGNPETIRLVLLDLTMPVLSGRGALQRIRALRPELPVLLFSGYNEAEAMRQINDGALAGFLKKPFTTDELRTKVAAVLRRANSAAAGREVE